MNTEIVPDTFPSLFWGYAAVWIIMALYLGYLGVRIARLERLSRTTTSSPTTEK